MIQRSGQDTDGEGTTGMVEEKTRENPKGSAGGLATGLQLGGIEPGGGPGATIGSIGTGGGSDDNLPTGDADRNNIDEEQQ